jgi:hypothetical protein
MCNRFNLRTLRTRGTAHRTAGSRDHALDNFYPSSQRRSGRERFSEECEYQASMADKVELILNRLLPAPCTQDTVGISYLVGL